MKNAILLSVFLVSATSLSAGEIVPIPDKVAPAVADRQVMQVPDRVQLSGMIGGRIHNSIANRLLAIDVDRLLEGYRKRPGRQTWDGEHIGKWLHAGTLAWANTGDTKLRAKLDLAVRELIKCQLDDGYLGTYAPSQRWTEWDVWAHKYNLLGLITYMRYTGDMTPLPACCRMGDLLCNTFGDVLGKRDILKAGEHVGMAPTSVLEPMALLYRLTGETKYRDFCEYIVRAWEKPDGPHIVSRLLDGKRVDRVGNGKAYEMLSCINGLLEWYRTTGKREYLVAADNAWTDIVSKRQYITGAVSVQDHFRDDFVLPNALGTYGDPKAGGSENCDTITWLQLNAQLLRLMGAARFANQLERVVYNQVLAAQRPDGAAWCDLTALEGKRKYGQDSCSCCLSSGPRGLALIPTFAVTSDANGIVVNFYDAAIADVALCGGAKVRVQIDTHYPAAGKVEISVDPSGDAANRTFDVKLRIPEWTSGAAVRVNGEAVTGVAAADSYAVIRRTWTRGDKIELQLPVEPRVVVGDHGNQGKAAICYGPVVLAADFGLLNDETRSIDSIALASTDPTKLQIVPEPAPGAFKTWPDAKAYLVNVVVEGSGATRTRIRFVPFAVAGTTGKNFKVWIPLSKTANGLVLSISDRDSALCFGNVVDINESAWTTLW